jgi:hypothetical protein
MSEERMKKTLSDLTAKLRKKMEERDHPRLREWLKDPGQTTIKLPAPMRKLPKRYLREVAVGETVFVSVAARRVDAESNCFLNPQAEILDHAITGIRVERREDGYHVMLFEGAFWEPDGRRARWLVSDLEHHRDQRLAAGRTSRCCGSMWLRN